MAVPITRTNIELLDESRCYFDLHLALAAGVIRRKYGCGYAWGDDYVGVPLKLANHRTELGMRVCAAGDGRDLGFYSHCQLLIDFLHIVAVDVDADVDVLIFGIAFLVHIRSDGHPVAAADLIRRAIIVCGENRRVAAAVDDVSCGVDLFDNEIGLVVFQRN